MTFQFKKQYCSSSLPSSKNIMLFHDQEIARIQHYKKSLFWVQVQMKNHFYTPNHQPLFVPYYV